MKARVPRFPPTQYLSVVDLVSAHLSEVEAQGADIVLRVSIQDVLLPPFTSKVFDTLACHQNLHQRVAVVIPITVPLQVLDLYLLKKFATLMYPQ